MVGRSRQEADWGLIGRCSTGGMGAWRRVEYAAPPGSQIVFVAGPEENRPQFPYLSGRPSSESSSWSSPRAEATSARNSISETSFGILSSSCDWWTEYAWQCPRVALVDEDDDERPEGKNCLMTEA